MSEEQKEEVLITISEAELATKLDEARNKGANMLYGELIGFQMKNLEIFAQQFRPQNTSWENFLGFVLFTLQKDFNDKYANKELTPEDTDEKDDGQPKAMQSEDKEGEESPKGGHEDVQQGEEGRQEANQELEPKKEEEEVTT